jgi:hypothetical protein
MAIDLKNKQKQLRSSYSTTSNPMKLTRVSSYFQGGTDLFSFCGCEIPVYIKNALSSPHMLSNAWA